MNKPLAWIRAAAIILKMRQMNKQRFNDILREATIYLDERAKEIQFNGRECKFSHLGKEVTLLACEPEIIEIFFDESYGKLDVDGKTVIDVGCASADTAIYLAMHGAKKVIGYDCSPEAVMFGKRNIALNGMEETITISERMVAGLGELPEADALKMDIEGAEHEIFAKASDAEIRKFKEIVLEFHDGHQDLKGRLEKAGYAVSVGNFTFNGRNGILHAVMKE